MTAGQHGRRVRRRWLRSFSGRRWAWVAGGLLGLLGAAVGGLVVAYPAAAALACPGCYGLERVGPNLYVEQGLPSRQRSHVVEVVERGKRQVSDFYGRRLSSPRLLVCSTRSCYRRIGGGGERGKALLDRAVLLSPRGIDPVIVAHELSHIELHRRLGRGDEVPRWFNEGLAVVVADDPRYLRPGRGADRCRVDADEDFYAKSACRVSRWIDGHGGRAAVLDLIERLSAGAKFDEVRRSAGN